MGNTTPSNISGLQIFLELLVLAVLLLTARILFLIHRATTGHGSRPQTSPRLQPCSTVICLGSGGHTSEMLALIKGLDFTKYSPRHYIMVDTDPLSGSRAIALETKKGAGEHNILSIPRSRSVHQSWISSVFTTALASLCCIVPVLRARPGLLLCNGPGACVPVVLVSFLAGALGVVPLPRIVFLESYCRTRSLSLTGKIMLYLADNFLVQWPRLQRRYPRTEYIGQLL